MRAPVSGLVRSRLAGCLPNRKASDRLRTFYIVLALLILSFPRWVVGQPVVMVVHSYSPQLPWVQDMSNGIEGVLGKKAKLASVYLGAKRRNAAEMSEGAKSLIQFYQGLQPDLVIISDDAALSHVGKEIGLETPIVFTGINGDLRRDFRWVTSRQNITGVMERPLIRRTILEMVRITGLESRRALILIGNSVSANAAFRTDLEGQASFPVWDHLHAEVRQVNSYQEWRREVLESKAAGFDLILASGFLAMRDEQGLYIEGEDLVRWTGQNSPIPVFTVNPQSIGEHGLVGGMVVNANELGTLAANLAQQILCKQVGPQDLPIVFLDKGDLVFSTSQLKRWGLSIAPKYNSLIRRVP